MELGTSNSQVVYLLRSVAASYTLRGVDRFRIIAYERAADVIDHLGGELHDLWQAGSLTNIEGIGKILTERLDDYFKNGNKSFLVMEYSKTPATVYQLMQVPGIGAKTAYKLISEFHIENSMSILKDIKKIAEQNKIAPLPGFGTKSQADILSSLKTTQTKIFETKRLRIDQADSVFQSMIEYLQENPKVIKIYPVGSLRRNSPTIGDVDIVAVCHDDDSSGVIKYFIDHPQTSIIEGKGEHKGAIILNTGIKVQLRTISPDKLGAMLQYNTGSKEHNIKLREYALRRGYSLSEYGITTLENRKVHKEINMKYFSTEEKFYNFLGLQYIPPEIRVGKNEIELASKKKILKLVEINDIKGDLQMHSSYPIEPSHDLGADSYQDLLTEANKLKYEYVAFTDHNPSNGNHTDAQIISILKTRFEHIKTTLSKNKQRTQYYISLEVDIRPDGTLAIPYEGLKYVDFILMSIHSSFSQKRADMTKRILTAMQFPKVKIFAHPTTRLVGSRDEIDADWNMIFKEAKAKGIALEINGAPERLDLPDNLIIKAHAYGCKFSLGTDSHQKKQLKNMKYAVSMARRGGLQKSDIINTMDYLSVKNYLLK